MSTILKRIERIALTVLCTIGLGSPTLQAQETRVLSMGWESWEPYQYQTSTGELTGLDIELMKAIFANMGYSLRFSEVPWKRHLLELEEGRIDIAAAASKTPERQAYAFFSVQPYRTESAVLYVRRGEAGTYRLNEFKDMIAISFRLGTTRGYYYGEQYKEILKRPKFRALVQEVKNDQLNYAKLLEKRIDGFLADPVTATAGLKREGLLNQVETHPLPIHANDIFVMFSKKSATSDIVAAFDKSLTQLKADGAYQAIFKKYLE